MFLREYASMHTDVHGNAGSAAWRCSFICCTLKTQAQYFAFLLENKTLTELSDINQHLSQTSYSQLKVPKLFPQISVVLGPTFMNKHN